MINLITFCKNSAKTIEPIKKARIGLMKCSISFIKVLATIYIETESMSDSDVSGVLIGISSFGWIAK